MKNIKSLVLLGIVALLASCSTSNDVVSNGLIQKRKYRKGYYFEKNAEKGFSKSEVDQNEVAVVDYPTENPTNNMVNENNTNVIEALEKTSTVSDDLDATFESIEVQNSDIAVSQADKDYITLPKIKDIKRVQSKIYAAKKLPESAAAAESGAMLVLLIILCLILPPVAIAIYSGITTWFWLDLLLFVLAISGWFFIGGLSGLAGLAAVIIAFLVIFDVI